MRFKMRVDKNLLFVETVNLPSEIFYSSETEK